MKKLKGLLGSVLILCSTMIDCKGGVQNTPVMAEEPAAKTTAKHYEFAMLARVFGKELQHLSPEQRNHADQYIRDLVEKRLKPGTSEEDHLKLLIHKEFPAVSEAYAIQYIEEKLTPKNKLFTEFGLSLKSLGINLDEIREHLDPQDYGKLVNLLELRLRNDSRVGPNTPLRKELNALLQKGGYHGSIPGGNELEKLLARTQKHSPSPRELLAKREALEAAAQATVEERKAKVLQTEEKKIAKEDPSLNKPLQPEEQHVLDLILSEEEQKLLTPEERRLFINILRKQFGNARKKGKKLSPTQEAISRLVIEKAAHRNPDALGIIRDLINLLASHQLELQGQVIGGSGYNREELKKHEETLIAHIEKGKLSERQRKLLNEYFEDLHRYWMKHYPKIQSAPQSTAGATSSAIASPTTMAPSATLIKEEVAEQSTVTTPSGVSSIPMVPAEPVKPQRFVSPGLNEIQELRTNKQYNVAEKNNLTVTPTRHEIEQAKPEFKSLAVVESMAIGKYKIAYDTWPVNSRKGSFEDITAKVKPSFDVLKPHDQLETLKVIVGDAHLLSLLTEKDQKWVKGRILELEKPQAPSSVPSTPLEPTATANSRAGFFSAPTSVATSTSVTTNASVPSTAVTAATPTITPTPTTGAGLLSLFSPAGNEPSSAANAFAAVLAAEKSKR